MTASNNFPLSNHLLYDGHDVDDNLFWRASAEGLLEFSETGSADSYSSDLDPDQVGAQTLEVTGSFQITVDLRSGVNQLSVDASLAQALAT